VRVDQLVEYSYSYQGYQCSSVGSKDLDGADILHGIMPYAIKIDRL